MINDRVGLSKQEIVTTGEAIASMIINGLGFNSEPLIYHHIFSRINHFTNISLTYSFIF